MILHWRPRPAPLSVEGCWAQGSAAVELRRKVLARADSSLRVAEAEDQLVALGAEPPWVEGAVFLARVGRLYLPTLWEPDLPLPWLEAGLEKLGAPPWMLLPSGRALGLSRARAL